jgi:hypothetical protein
MASVGSSRNGCATIGRSQPSQRDMPRDKSESSPSVPCDVLGTSKSRHCTRIFMSRRYLRPLVDKLEDGLVTCSDV